MTPDAQDKKDALQAVFSRTAESYERIRYFHIYGQWLVDCALVTVGARVLDVACGRGAVLFPAVARVGPGGHVIGIDLAEGMARETAAEIQRRGISHAEARQMDAETLVFGDASFDFVLCGFSLQFLPHLDRALGGFRRVLRPGGTLAVTTWGADDQRWDWFESLRAEHQAVVKLGSQKLDSPEVIRSRFAAGGFHHVDVVPKELDMVYADEEEWWNVEWSISGRAGLDRLAPEALARFKAECFARVQSQREADGFHYRLLAFCATTRA